MNNEHENPLTDPELDRQLMEFLETDEFSTYMVAYLAITSEETVAIASFNFLEFEPFERAHAVKLRDYLRTGEGIDKIKELRDQCKKDPEAMYDWMYGYFQTMLTSDSEE